MIKIRNIDMPKSCAECTLSCEDKYADTYCVPLGEEQNPYSIEYKTERLPDCPLIDIEKERVEAEDKEGVPASSDEATGTYYYVNMESDFFRWSGIIEFKNDCPTKEEIEELTENYKYRIVCIQKLHKEVAC